MPESSPYEAEKAAARANRAFYAAFERLDLEEMRRVWLDDDRIQCVHPGWELLTGRRRVLASWARIFENTASIRFDVADLEVRVIGDLAWITGIENIRSDAGGSRFTSQAVATNLFLRTGDGFRMILHHGSPVAQRGFDALLEEP